MSSEFGRASNRRFDALRRGEIEREALSHGMSVKDFVASAHQAAQTSTPLPPESRPGPSWPSQGNADADQAHEAIGGGTDQHKVVFSRRKVVLSLVVTVVLAAAISAVAIPLGIRAAQRRDSDSDAYLVQITAELRCTADSAIRSSSHGGRYASCSVMATTRPPGNVDPNWWKDAGSTVTVTSSPAGALAEARGYCDDPSLSRDVNSFNFVYYSDRWVLQAGYRNLDPGDALEGPPTPQVSAAIAMGATRLFC